MCRHFAYASSLPQRCAEPRTQTAGNPSQSLGLLAPRQTACSGMTPGLHFCSSATALYPKGIKKGERVVVPDIREDRLRTGHLRPLDILFKSFLFGHQSCIRGIVKTIEGLATCAAGGRQHGRVVVSRAPSPGRRHLQTSTTPHPHPGKG